MDFQGQDALKASLLLECYQEDNLHARHLENQRLEIAKFILTLQLTIAGAIGYEIHEQHPYWSVLLEVLFTALAHSGFHVTSALLERFFSHRHRASLLRNRILLHGATPSTELEKEDSPASVACTEIQKEIRFRTFWKILYSLMTLLGISSLLSTAFWMYRKPIPTFAFGLVPWSWLAPVLIAGFSALKLCGQMKAHADWEKKERELRIRIYGDAETPQYKPAGFWRSLRTRLFY